MESTEIGVVELSFGQLANIEEAIRLRIHCSAQKKPFYFHVHDHRVVFKNIVFRFSILLKSFRILSFQKCWIEYPKPLTVVVFDDASRKRLGSVKIRLDSTGEKNVLLNRHSVLSFDVKHTIK